MSGCVVDSNTMHESVASGVLMSDVQYQWGPDVVSQATILPIGGTIYRMHQVTGTTDVKAIGAPVDGDHSSRIVTLYGASGAAGTQFVLKDRAAGGNLKIRGGHDFGLYPTETMTFAWHAADAFWWEIDRSVNKQVVSGKSTAGPVGINSGSEASPMSVIVILPLTSFDGKSPFEIDMSIPEGGTTDGGNASIALYQDGTSIGVVYRADQAANGFGAMYMRAWVTPPAGDHTYAFKCWATAGSFSCLGGTGGLGTFFPITASITRVDP